jgi:precorrin-6B methylase 2
MKKKRAAAVQPDDDDDDDDDDDGVVVPKGGGGSSGGRDDGSSSSKSPRIKKQPRKTSASTDDPLCVASSTSVAAADDPATTNVCALIETAYCNVDGYGIARDAKRQQREAGVFHDGIQFGEVRVESFLTALGWLSPQPGESFVDLGSGTGKAVLTAAAAYPLAAADGVELLRPLHDAGAAALERCRSSLRTPNVNLTCADALEYPWSTYDLVFVTLTCFTDEMVERVRATASKLRKGARLLVTSRPLDNAGLRLIRREKLPYGGKHGMMSYLAYERV